MSLYPETTPGGGFLVPGFARCTAMKVAAPQPTIGHVGTDFLGSSKSFYVRQYAKASYPSFFIDQLTPEFLMRAIWYQTEESEFSLTQKNLGHVTHFGDKDGEFTQAVISANGNGSWKKDGLHFFLKGDLGNTSGRPFDGPVLERYAKDNYEIFLHIPWEVLKFMFYSERYFITACYERYAR